MKFVNIPFSILCKLQKVVIDSNYRDYDKNSLIVKKYVSYHINDDIYGEIINEQLISNYIELTNLYSKLATILATINYKNIDDIIDYVLYSLSINTLTTLKLNMKGYIKKSIFEYVWFFKNSNYYNTTLFSL